jgi:hypothetical protein
MTFTRAFGFLQGIAGCERSVAVDEQSFCEHKVGGHSACFEHDGAMLAVDEPLPEGF